MSAAKKFDLKASGDHSLAHRDRRCEKTRPSLGAGMRCKSGSAVSDADFSRLAMRAAKRVKSSKNKERATHLVCSHLKSLLLQGLAGAPKVQGAKSAARTIGRPRRAVVHRVMASDASIHPLTHQRLNMTASIERQIGLPI